jgi:hypothetical protein
MRRILSLLVSIALLAASFATLLSPSALAETTLVTCTDLKTQKTVVLRANLKSCKPLHAAAAWRIQQSDSSAHSGAGYAKLRTCTSKRAQFDYQLLKSNCATHQNTNDYWRTVTALEIPIITIANARGYDSAAFALATTTQNPDAPIAYYLITNNKTGQINKVSPNNNGELSLSNLSPLTSYTFTIAAVNVDGTSPTSAITPAITTGAVPVVVVAPTAAPLAAPAFSLSSSSETKTVNNAIIGYTVTSSGGAIASYSISPTAPAGLTFSTSTGLLSGTPTSVAVATAYTITATNASGSATRTFTLTVIAVTCANGGTCILGDTGPGGGKIFYVASTPFACGPTRASTCNYLEAAPVSGTNAWTDALYAWSGNTTVEIFGSAQLSQVGEGYANTLAIIGQSGGGDVAEKAATKSQAYRGPNNLTDWYLPSKDELNQMCKWAKGITGTALTTLTTVCSGGTINTGVGAAGFLASDATYVYYRSSTESNATYAWSQRFNDGVQTSGQGKSNSLYVRPVRAF